MRIWDIHPGYLNRQSLLGEHRELHGLVSIMVNGKKGYSHHPETVRWLGHGWAIRQRHKQLACEMALRGYVDQSPVKTRSNTGVWPAVYIDSPHVQYQLLAEKYVHKDPGRIPLPKDQQVLWRHHKYSVMARDPAKYKTIGQAVAKGNIGFEQLSQTLVELLRVEPKEGGIRNAVQHMWGYVSEVGEAKPDVNALSTRRLLLLTQENARQMNEPYICESTALSELMVWL